MSRLKVCPGIINYAIGINPHRIITPGVRIIHTTCGVPDFSEAKDMGKNLVKSLVRKFTR